MANETTQDELVEQIQLLVSADAIWYSPEDHIPMSEVEQLDIGLPATTATRIIALVRAHAWQAADDPTVMREVASAISQIPFTVLDPRITARTAAAALLSALLGPRPQESNDE